MSLTLEKVVDTSKNVGKGIVLVGKKAGKVAANAGKKIVDVTVKAGKVIGKEGAKLANTAKVNMDMNDKKKKLDIVMQKIGEIIYTEDVDINVFDIKKIKNEIHNLYEEINDAKNKIKELKIKDGNNTETIKGIEKELKKVIKEEVSKKVIKIVKKYIRDGEPDIIKYKAIIIMKQNRIKELEKTLGRILIDKEIIIENGDIEEAIEKAKQLQKEITECKEKLKEIQ